MDWFPVGSVITWFCVCLLYFLIFSRSYMAATLDTSQLEDEKAGALSAATNELERIFEKKDFARMKVVIVVSVFGCFTICMVLWQNSWLRLALTIMCIYFSYFGCIAFSQKLLLCVIIPFFYSLVLFTVMHWQDWL